MQAHTPIDGSMDYIDSRDVIARIEWLEVFTNGEYDTETENGLDEAERDELRALRALAEEASGYSDDWEYGAQLIRDTVFADYTEQLAEDCGYLQDTGDRWPFNHIDWDSAADDLKQDYTSVEFDGAEYWVR